MASNPKPIKAMPATTSVPNNTPLSSSPPTPRNNVFNVSADCAIASDDDFEDDDDVESLSEFQKCIEESVRARFGNGGSNTSSNRSSVSRTSNLTLMIEQGERAERERAQARKEQEEQGILLGPESPPADAANDGSPLSTAENKKKPGMTGRDVNNDEGCRYGLPELPAKDFCFLKEVYKLHKRKVLPSDRDWWLGQDKYRLVW